MAIYCDLCRRKIGFFETKYPFYPYNFLCEECCILKSREKAEKEKREAEKRAAEKEKAEKEEAEKREAERLRKKEIERAERIARAEAKRRATAEKLAKQREKKRKKKELDKLKEKKKEEELETISNRLKEQILSNEVIFYKCNELLAEYQVKSNTITNILGKMPIMYKFSELEKMTKIETILNTMKENRKTYTEYEKELRYKYEKEPVFLLKECSKSILNIEPTIVNTLKDDIEKINENLDEKLKDIRIMQDEYDKASTISPYELSLPKNKKYKKIIEEYQMREKEKKKFQEELKFKKFLLVYFCAISLLYLIKMEENAKKLQKNKELYLIYENLVNAKMSKEYISEKIFELYNEFYLKIFDHKLEKEEIECIIYILEQERFYSSASIKDVDSDFKTIKKEITKEKTTKEKIKLIENFTVSNSLKMIDGIKIDIDTKLKIQIYFIHIINALQEKLNLIELFEIIGKFDVIFEKIKKSVKSDNLAKERERLLKGDLSKELEIKKLELDFNSIKDGFEFEEYVAKLYEKLGYRIEEVTRKSGDQRSGCYCAKRQYKICYPS